MVRAAAFVLTATLSASALAASIPSASPAWNGTWKSNPAKSQITGRTLSYAKEGAGFRYIDGGYLNFTFACDGKDYPINFEGYALACKQTGANTFEMADKVKVGGKTTGRDTLTLSDGGKTLTDKDVDDEPGGKTHTTVTTYQRIAGSPSDGLAGTWKSVKRETTPRTLTYKITGDHVLLTYPMSQDSIEAKLDGTPGIVKGPDIPADARESITLLAPDKIHLVALHNGTPFAEITDTLSPDGKTITSVAYLVGKENEKTTQIFEKQ